MALDSVQNFSLNYTPPSWLRESFQTGQKKMSISCSNIAGPRQSKWVFNGKQSHWLSMTTNNYVPEITFTSLADTCKVTLSGDPSRCKDLKQLLTILEETMLMEDY